MKPLLLAVLLSGGWGLAQTPSVTPDSQLPDQVTVKPQTVRGCLHSAGDNYTVIDQVSGKTFKLEGAIDRLKQYIGQTVEITGSVKSVDGDDKRAEAGTGDILTLSDVKQISDKCSSAPQTGRLDSREPVLLAWAQRPVSDDANTQLNSSAQMSSNAQETSAAAANTRSVTTDRTPRAVLPAGGHAGAHQLSVNTSDTRSVGESTAPAMSAAGYAANPNDRSLGSVSPQVRNPANQRSEANRDKPVPSYLNPEAIGTSEDEGNRAAEAASRAEMQTDASGKNTTFSTMRLSEANGTPKANPKETMQPSKDVKSETTPKAPQ